MTERIMFAAMAAALALGSCSGDQPRSREHNPEEFLSMLSKEPPSEELCLLVELVCGKPEHKGTAACKTLNDACGALGALDGGVVEDGEPPKPDAGPPATPGAPDLVVTAISWQPKSPQANDAVTFSATIKNVGSGPTPAGTILGVRFSIVGTTVTWSDHEKSALGSGKSVTVTANGGPAGSSTWKGVQGTFNLEAFVDDIDRIPGESDESNNKLSVSLAVGGGAPAPPTGQCATSLIPKPAKDHGLTKLAFCEDFSDPKRINLGTTLNSGQTFTQVSSGNIFGCSPLPASAISFSNGTMTVKPTHNQYQVDFISSVPSGSGFLLKGSGWYAEIRWKHADCGKSSNSSSAGFPAFWSMDARHLYQGAKVLLEPDFYENIGHSYVGALHRWDLTVSPKGHKSESTIQKMPAPPTQFFAAGAIAEPNNAGYAWYFNDKLMARKTPSWLSMFSDFRGPVMFGSGVGCDYTVDYVRVWTK